MKTRFLLIALLFITSCNSDNSETNTANNTQVASAIEQNLTSKSLLNEAAYIPSQCYTKTENEEGAIHNPCYSCHITAKVPNYSSDGDLQLSYSFPEYANTNNWTNLFKDRESSINVIKDQTILDYVRQDNYLNEKGEIKLAKVLANVPGGWDFDGDGQWSGVTPDCYYNFDEQGLTVTPKASIRLARICLYTLFGHFLAYQWLYR